MLCYINRGLILEQAIVDLVRQYFDTLNLQEKYKNFSLKVTTEHPFAELYLRNGLNASDSFPCVVVSTEEDRKPVELEELAVYETQGIGLEKADLDEIIKTTETYINKKGIEKTREIPGLCTVIDDKTIESISQTIENQGYCYGYAMRIRRKDTISLEVWAENVQLKNEIYEQLRLFVLGNLSHLLEAKYSFFDIALFDHTITGHRSNNYNFDFDVALSGAHISLDVNYCVEQIVLNTELHGLGSNNGDNFIMEVINYDPEKQYPPYIRGESYPAGGKVEPTTGTAIDGS